MSTGSVTIPGVCPDYNKFGYRLIHHVYSLAGKTTRIILTLEYLQLPDGVVRTYSYDEKACTDW